MSKERWEQDNIDDELDYGLTPLWKCQEQMVDIDEFFDSYVIDKMSDPMYDDIEDSPCFRRYQPYRPTILMSRCLYFPSFDGEEDVDDESQDQPSIEDICTPTPEIIGGVLNCEIMVDESPLPTLDQSTFNLMQRIFVEVNYPYGYNVFLWAHEGLMPQLPIQPGGTTQGTKDTKCIHLSADQNKIFDPGIHCT